jgi:WD40 repeat protein
MIHELNDHSSGKLLEVYPQALVTAELSADSRYLLIATHQGTLYWIGMQSREEKLLLDLPSPTDLSCAALSIDGRHAAAATNDGSIFLMNQKDDREWTAPSLLKGDSTSRIADLQFSHDGRLLAWSRSDGSICVWSVASGQIRYRWSGHDQPATAIAFLPDNRILSASLDDTIRLWEIDSQTEVWRQETGLLGVTALAASPDGKLAALGGYERKVPVWDLEASRKKFEIPVTVSNVWDIQFSPDNLAVALAGNDGVVRVHDAQTGSEKAVIQVRGRLPGTSRNFRDRSDLDWRFGDSL